MDVGMQMLSENLQQVEEVLAPDGDEVGAYAKSIAGSTYVACASPDDLVQKLKLHLAEPGVLEEWRSWSKKQRMAYCYRCMLLFFLGSIRKERNRKEVEREYARRSAEVMMGKYGMSEDTMYSDVREHIMSLLTPRQKLLLSMKIEQRMSTEDISQQMNSGAGAVHTMWCRIMRKLRDSAEVLMEVLR